MVFWIEIVAVLIAFLMLYLLFHTLKAAAPLIINSIVGFLVFFLINSIFNLGIVINFWSILIVALSGLTGVVLVLILHLLGLAF